MRRVPSVVIICCVSILPLSYAVKSRAAVVPYFHETFDHYTSFPDTIPTGDHVNAGAPEISEGADNFWYAARFKSGVGTIESDLAVQKSGGPDDNTPVGRVEDMAGLVFRVSTLGDTSAQLDFDWRTYLGETGHNFIVGYHVGDDLGFNTTTNRFLNLSWNNWTQLMSSAATDTFHHQTFSLPSNAAAVYVAFWFDDGERHYGKVDNITVSGSDPLIAPGVPEPGMLGLIGMLAMNIPGRRRSNA